MESFGPDRTVLTLPLQPAQVPLPGPRERVIAFLTDAAAASASEIAHAAGPDCGEALLSAMEREGVLTGEDTPEGRRYRLRW